MRSGKALMTSRREFLSNIVGIGLATAKAAAVESNEVGVTPSEIRLGWVGTLTGPVTALEADGS